MYDKVSKEITLQDGSKANIVIPQVIQVANSGYQYQYNGKEWQDELGLDWYDYGARNYDAALGRWMNLDPLADMYWALTPYKFSSNNPVSIVDVYGLYEIGSVTLTKEEEEELRSQYGKGKEYRNAKEEKVNKKKDNLRNAISRLKEFLDKNQDISKIFQDFSGISEGTTSWDDLWNENGKGPKHNLSGGISGKGFTMGTESITLNSSNSLLENMGTILHEYIHFGDNGRSNGYDGTNGGMPGYNADLQRSAIEDVIHYTLNNGIVKNIDPWISGYGPNSGYHIIDTNGKAVNVELGYGFEKIAFGYTITAPIQYRQAFLLKNTPKHSANGVQIEKLKPVKSLN